MGKRRKVPEDLMGSILGEDPGASGEDRTSPELHGPGVGSPLSADEGSIIWEEQPERVGTTFNLSKQVGRELYRLRLALQNEEGIHSSNSEIAEVALRIALEDARERGRESDLLQRLSGQPTEVAGAAGQTTRRSVDEAGFILETTYDENGRVVDEDVVATLADLPVEAEYVNEQGRVVSLARDDLGNAFEQVMDEAFNILETRLLERGP